MVGGIARRMSEYGFLCSFLIRTWHKYGTNIKIKNVLNGLFSISSSKYGKTRMYKGKSGVIE
jgi:hypothetical protein